MRARNVMRFQVFLRLPFFPLDFAHFAHLALCAAAIRSRASEESLRLPRLPLNVLSLDSACRALFSTVVVPHLDQSFECSLENNLRCKDKSPSACTLAEGPQSCQQLIACRRPPSIGTCCLRHPSRSRLPFVFCRQATQRPARRS